MMYFENMLTPGEFFLFASQLLLSHKSQLFLDHTANSHKELCLRFGEGERKLCQVIPSFSLISVTILFQPEAKILFVYVTSHDVLDDPT